MKGRPCAKNPEQQVRKLHEADIQKRYDQNVTPLCHTIAQQLLHMKPQILQRRHIARVEIVEIGLKQLCHGSGYDAEADGEVYDGFMILSAVIFPKFQGKDEGEGEQD